MVSHRLYNYRLSHFSDTYRYHLVQTINQYIVQDIKLEKRNHGIISSLSSDTSDAVYGTVEAGTSFETSLVLLVAEELTGG